MINFQKLLLYLPNVVVISTLFFLCGFILHAMCFISCGILHVIQNLLDQTDAQFRLFKFLFSCLLLGGSLVGILIGDVLFNPTLALGIGLIANAAGAILLLVTIYIQRTVFKICFIVFGGTAGLIGPILVTYIVDKFDDTKKIFGLPFIYSICCCHIVGSLYWLYTMRLMNHPSLLLIVSIICLALAFVMLYIIKLFLQNYFTSKSNTKINFGRLVFSRQIRMLAILGPAALLIVYVNLLDKSAHSWISTNFLFNQTNITVKRSFDPAIWFQQANIALYLIPLFLLFSIRFNLKRNIVLGCFAISVATFLWPYTAQTCVMNYNMTIIRTQMIVTHNTVLDERNAICDPNPMVLNGLFASLIFGRLIFISTMLIISSKGVDAQEQYIPKAGCFVLYYLAYVISSIIPFNFTIYNLMRISLLIILAMLFWGFLYLSGASRQQTADSGKSGNKDQDTGQDTVNEKSKDKIEKDNDSNFQEEKVADKIEKGPGTSKSEAPQAPPRRPSRPVAGVTRTSISRSSVARPRKRKPHK